MNILLINNNPAVSRLITISIEKLGYNLSEVKNIEEYDGEPCDIIFIDDEDYNDEVASMIKNMQLCKHISYIGKRGSDKPEAMDSILEKPFLPTDFTDMLEAICSNIERGEPTPKEENIAEKEPVSEEKVEDMEKEKKYILPEENSSLANLDEDLQSSFDEIDSMLDEAKPSDEKKDEEPASVLPSDTINEVKELLEDEEISTQEINLEDISEDDAEIEDISEHEPIEVISLDEFTNEDLTKETSIAKEPLDEVKLDDIVPHEDTDNIVINQEDEIEEIQIVHHEDEILEENEAIEEVVINQEDKIEQPQISTEEELEEAVKEVLEEDAKNDHAPEQESATEEEPTLEEIIIKEPDEEEIVSNDPAPEKEEFKIKETPKEKVEAFKIEEEPDEDIKAENILQAEEIQKELLTKPFEVSEAPVVEESEETAEELSHEIVEEKEAKEILPEVQEAKEEVALMEEETELIDESKVDEIEQEETIQEEKEIKMGDDFVGMLDASKLKNVLDESGGEAPQEEAETPSEGNSELKTELENELQESISKNVAEKLSDEKYKDILDSLKLNISISFGE